MADRVLWQVASWCLQYPDAALRERLPLLREAVAELGENPVAVAFGQFLDHARDRDLAAHYVDVFDSRPRRCLYLTWYTDGDTRRRGEALLRFKQTYRAHGVEPAGDELPDFLPTLLEFAATCPDTALPDAELLLAWSRPGVELLARNLARLDTPYAGLLAALLVTFPPALAPAAPQPGLELVGLDPYPRAVPTGGRR
ncbi:nitrate reductase molybdenum cofactor assembly chaperone [Amycolatopsis sp. NPDC051903]|uniref:nitrate reductase molybdenum cofactor assembly chaperone n=1 Tax=Amycolatopsis sp. NPDC051903 TaxID=3363936 RepID=UPI00379789BC